MRNATRIALVPGWIALVTTLVVALIIDTIPLSVQLLPLAVSVLLLGLPHGAVDHLLPARATGQPFSVRIAAIVGTVYLFAGGAYAIAWFFAPIAAFVVFILITWFHWGQGDLHPLYRLVGTTHPESRLAVARTVLVRGGMPMLVPLLAFPDQYRLVAGWLVSLFDPDAVTALEPVFTPETRLLLAVGFGTLVASTLAIGYLRGDRRVWLVDASETLLLLTFFATVPPILAIGVYFCAWHSLRHVVRYLLLDERTADALETGRPLAAFARFGRDAAPLTALSLLIAVAIYVTAPGATNAPEDLLAVYLVFIAVLTLPHVLFVSWLDWRGYVP